MEPTSPHSSIANPASPHSWIANPGPGPVQIKCRPSVVLSVQKMVPAGDSRLHFGLDLDLGQGGMRPRIRLEREMGSLGTVAISQAGLSIR
eukprot:1184275-Prorocentrum_minimum.AAC.2